MGGEICKNCGKGILLRKGKRTKVRCTNCGHWKYRSPNQSSPGSLIGSIRTEPKITGSCPPEHEEKRRSKKKKTKEISKIESKPEKLLPSDTDYEKKKAGRDMMIRLQRREYSIQKILKKLRKNNKYANLGKTVIIEGELFDLETGERVYKEPEPNKADVVE